jgi:hypothetical protein
LSGCLLEFTLAEDSPCFKQLLQVLLLSIGFADYLLPPVIVVSDLLLLLLGYEPVLFETFNGLEEEGL